MTPLPNSRRQFLAGVGAMGGVVVLSACAARLPTAIPGNGEGSFAFSQGVSSADPKPNAIMLWTRVESASGGDIPLLIQVAGDMSFAQVVVEREVSATALFDHTARVLVEGLEPDRFYWFRFLAPDGLASRVGRTRTAPLPNDPQKVRLALFSCQQYDGGFFTAYRRLIADDAALPESDRLHAIVHVGDYIYDNSGGRIPSQDLEIIDLVNSDGTPRKIGSYPSGGIRGGPGGPTSRLAVTLADYRHLYRTYLSDPDLQDARALYPFIQTWDDHEFINDSWQGFGGEKALQRQRYDATKAWFEYCPAILSSENAPDAAFNRAQVENAAVAPAASANDEFLVTEPNNLAAISALSIYRSLRLGKHVELVVTDCRSYRGPRGLDDAILDTGEVKYPASPVPPEVVAVQAAGRSANGGNPPATISYQGSELPNRRRHDPPTTMLGSLQEKWIRQELHRSNATWRTLVTSTPLMRFGFDMRFRDPQLPNGLLWTDGWDGYPHSRHSLVDHIAQRGYSNVISLSGDRHAHFAGSVQADFDDEASAGVFPEYVCTGASAYCRAKAQSLSFGKDDELIRRVAIETEPGKYYYRMAPTLNAWLLHGGDAANALGPHLNTHAAWNVAREDVNPHLAYADTDAYGYAIITFNEERVEAEFVTLREPLDQDDIPLRRVRFSNGKGARSMLQFEDVEGAPPLMGLRDRIAGGDA